MGLFKTHESRTVDIENLFEKFRQSYIKGDLSSAEKILISFFDLPLSDYQKGMTYSNLGATYNLLGKYDEALNSYTRAETIMLNNNDDWGLGAIYINKAIIYNIKKSYPQAIQYYEKGIRIFLKEGKKDPESLDRNSKAYYNLAVTYFNTGQYKVALKYLNESLRIRRENKLPEAGLVLLNIAKTYSELNRYDEADSYFRQSIADVIREHGADYFRLPEFYFGYSEFLRKTGKDADAMETLRKSLKICLKAYGLKNNITSLAFKNIGELYFKNGSYDSSLFYYQRSLISVVKDFNNENVYSNPSPDSSFLNIRLLDNLKGKSKVLEACSESKKDLAGKLKTMSAALETTEICLRLIDIIRNSYPSEESQMYLSENEKETYITAIRLAAGIASLSGDITTDGIYSLVQKEKASILRNQIAGNNLLNSLVVPDSLREKMRYISSRIADYNKYLSEIQKDDSLKIGECKDKLFDLNREKEKTLQAVSSAIPGYDELMKKTDPVAVETIRRDLRTDEMILDYFLSNETKDNRRKLYIFLITRNKVQFSETYLGPEFAYYAGLLRNTTDPTSGSAEKCINEYATGLYYMYRSLILPVENKITCKRLIIIPDEELGWLPFEAFLKEPHEKGKSDFEGSHFLIRDYIISYGYSSSLLDEGLEPFKNRTRILSFTPEYSKTDQAALDGALNEISKINTLFGGRCYTGHEATKTNFLKSINEPAIFHLAMHSIPDSTNSLYSYMLFDPGDQNDGKLYNYEISLSNLKSPMIVLSSCNSGSGKIFSGEGLMSLARSFILAGASSVVRTSWEVNDDASSEIITAFYKILKKGRNKDEALREAKLEYLKKSPPVFMHPYYWAAYQVVGDNGPVYENNKPVIVTIVTITGLIIFIIIWLRGRRII
jgi:CHAT domain-containing protein/tetratricopeptide (TPR) repeat protein